VQDSSSPVQINNFHLSEREKEVAARLKCLNVEMLKC